MLLLVQLSYLLRTSSGLQTLNTHCTTCAIYVTEVENGAKVQV